MSNKVELKYLGIGKRRIAWSSMGKLYSYVVNENDTIVVPESQVTAACSFAPLQRVGIVESNIGFTKKKSTKDKKRTTNDKILNTISNDNEIEKTECDDIEVVNISIEDEEPVKGVFETQDIQRVLDKQPTIEKVKEETGEIVEGSKVEVVSGNFEGMTGEVIKITNGGVYRVKLNNDDKKYRRIDNDILKVIE